MKMTFPIWKAIGYHTAPLQLLQDHMFLSKHTLAMGFAIQYVHSFKILE